MIAQIVVGRVVAILRHGRRQAHLVGRGRGRKLAKQILGASETERGPKLLSEGRGGGRGRGQLLRIVAGRLLVVEMMVVVVVGGGAGGGVGVVVRF